MTEFMHNVAIGEGGINCSSCHDIGGLTQNVNFTAMNRTDTIHSDLNRGAATTPEYKPNERCWGCHGDGNRSEAAQPTKTHPVRYNAPRNCTDCHLTTGSDNANWTLLNVTEHYWDAEDIYTTDATTCYVCHNKTEMMIPPIEVNDPDGAGTVYGGAHGGNESTSHYGLIRSDLSSIVDTEPYCDYCHDNTSTVFPVSGVNQSIADHTTETNDPSCNNTNCHNVGRIHNNSLAKPGTNDALCQQCHASPTYNRHNDTVNCTTCHTNVTGDIHPIKYLQENGSYLNTTTDAANCTTCHQSTAADAVLSEDGFNAPKIPTAANFDFSHSESTSAGQKWGNYWDNTTGTDLPACLYCHENTTHNDTALGKVTYVQGGTVGVNESIGTSYWCANCHYNQSAYYGGTNYTPVPPDIKNASLTATDGTDTTDSSCKGCHGGLLVGNHMTEFMHNAAIGVSGGTDCVYCHNLSAPAGESPMSKRINDTAANASVHKNLNAGANTSGLSTPLNAACWACHGNGTRPEEHPTNYSQPQNCSYCHVDNRYNATLVYRHYPSAVFGGVKRTYNSSGANCSICHNNSLVADYYIGDSYSHPIDANVSHYANRTGLINTSDLTNCEKCHRELNSTYGNPTYISPNTHNEGAGYDVNCEHVCHNSVYAPNNITINLHNASIGIYVDSCFISDTYPQYGCHESSGGW